MAWECAECLRNQMTTVCHHCGKPLCGEHVVVIVDDALSGDEGTVTTRAHTLSGRARHCADCQKQHHPRAQVVKQPELTPVTT
jgi:hypothetical protein